MDEEILNESIWDKFKRLFGTSSLDVYKRQIEYNVCPGMNQITCGPNFGTLTERVLEDVFITKSLRYAQN